MGMPFLTRPLVAAEATRMRRVVFVSAYRPILALTVHLLLVQAVFRGSPSHK